VSASNAPLSDCRVSSVSRTLFLDCEAPSALCKPLSKFGITFLDLGATASALNKLPLDCGDWEGMSSDRGRTDSTYSLLGMLAIVKDQVNTAPLHDYSPGIHQSYHCEQNWFPDPWISAGSRKVIEWMLYKQ